MFIVLLHFQCHVIKKGRKSKVQKECIQKIQTVNSLDDIIVQYHNNLF